MADSVYKIIVQFEAMNLIQGGSSGSGGGGGSSKGGTGSDVSIDISSFKKEFNSLLSGFKALTSSITQVNNIVATLKQGTAAAAANVASTGSPKTSSGLVDAGGRPLTAATSQRVDAEKAAAAAASANADATRDSTKASEERTAALKEEAEQAAKADAASGKIGSTLAELHKHFQKVASSVEGTTEILEESGNTLADINNRIGGRLNPAQLLNKVLAPVANDSTFRQRATKLQDSLGDFFDIDTKGLASDAQNAARHLQSEIESAIRKELNKLSNSGLDDDIGRILSNLRKNIQERLETARAGGTTGLRFDQKKFAESFSAAEIVHTFDLITSAINNAEGVLKEGSQEFNAFADSMGSSITKLRNVFARELGNTRRETFSGLVDEGGRRLDFRPQLLQEINPAQTQIDLTKLQQAIVNLGINSIKTSQPLSVATKLFDLLATDMGNLEGNLRAVRVAFKNTEEGFDPITRKRFDELQGLLKINRSSSGVVRGPSNVAAGAASGAFGVFRINQLREQVARTGAPLSENISFTDASGNIRRVHVELKQLGSTLDTVRVKAKEVSDNMFDRASVRTALQRVAVWGAAAGIIFGAVSAFKSGVQTVTDTEFSIASLAKVMDEAQADFAGFKKSATDTAIAISQQFGQPLKDVIDTMITFAQQGKNLAQVTRLTEASALAANVTTLDQPTAGSVLTSVTEQFNIPVENATSIVDKFNNVANNAAVTETQLAEALKRAGNAAVNAGVDLDQFNGIVAAISQQTRQTGSEIGTALKFVFSRINTPEAEKGLARVGVAVRDAEGGMRPFVEIVSDLSAAFDTLSEAQQNQVAISVAGAHRYNTFLALIKNFSQFQLSAADSTNSAGSALREQSRIAETAQFKIQQLKNSISSAAVSVGEAFLPTLKGATVVAREFFDVISGLPTAVTFVGTSFTLALVAFTKFSDQMVNFIDLFDSSGGGGIFRSIATGLKGAGTSIDNQRDRDPASFAKFGSSAPGVLLARTLSDFSFKKPVSEVEDFVSVLGKANLKLVDSNGKIVENTKGLTKFAAVTRGLGVASKFDDTGKALDRTALGIAALNGGFGKLAGTVLKMSNALASFAGVGKGIDFLANRIGATSSAVGLLATDIVKLGASFALIAGGIALFGAIKDAITENGESVREDLKEEIAARNETIKAIKKQQTEVDALSRSRSRAALNAARVASTDRDIIDEDIRRGKFRSPLLDEQRLNKSQIELDNSVGFANPELIQGVDEFGNAILRSAQAFDVLAQAATSAQTQILAATQVKVVEAFARDLDGDASDGPLKRLGRSAIQSVGKFVGGLPGVNDNLLADFGDDAQTIFKERQAAFEQIQNDPRVKEAKRLNIDLSITEGEDFAKEFDNKAKELQAAGAKLSEVVQKIRAEIGNIPEDAIGQLFQSSSFRDLAALESRRLSAESGTRVTSGDFSQQLLLQNSSALRGVRNNIGFGGAETRAQLNEKGILQATIDVRNDVEQKLSGLKGGELVILEGLLGTPDQVQVVVDEFGTRLARFIDETTGKIKLRPLSELIQEGNLRDIEVFDTTKLKKQLDTVALELGRVVSGGARGALIDTDLNLGNLRRFQSTGQQAASLRDQLLTSDVLEARQDVATSRETFKTKIDEGDANISIETVDAFNKLAVRQDTLDTIFKFRSEIEAVGLAFEQSLDQIDSQKIKDTIKAQFSGILGAGAGAIDNRAGTPQLRSELSADQIFQTSAKGIISASNSIVDGEKAIGEFLANRVDLARSISLATGEFNKAQSGGVRDPRLITELTRAATERAEAGATATENLQLAIAEESRDEAKKQTDLLQKLVDESKSPESLAGGIAAGAEFSSKLGPKALEDFGRQLSTLSPEKLAGIKDTSSLVAAAKALQGNTPQNVRNELISRQASIAAARVAGELIPSGDKSDEAKSLKDSAKAIESLAKPQRNEIAAIFSKFSQTSGEITDKVAKDAALEFAAVLKRSDSDNTSDAGERIEEGIRDGNKDLIEQFKRAIQSTRILPSGSSSVPEKERERTVDEENKTIQRHTEILNIATVALKKMIEPVKAAQAALHRLGQEASIAMTGVRDSLANSITSILSSRALGSLGASTQSGALAGVRSISSNTGKSFLDGSGKIALSGRELTERENQNLVAANEDLNTALSGNKEAIQALAKEEQKIKQIRDEAVASGDTAGAAAATETLKQLGSQQDLLRAQANGLADGLGRLGDAFNKLDSINQLRVDVENLFRTFDRQKEFEFDTTSIDSALGKTPFSFTRPTFEQFQQGQGGRLTKFERDNASIDFKLRSGEISQQDATVARQRSEFDNNEEIIALAQKRETDRFQAEVSAAQQVMNRLADFSTSGSSLAGQAKELADSLRDDLEQAGDVIKSDVGSRTIRDPRTGQDIEVPASEVLQFRGVQGLESVRGRVNELAAEAKKEEQAANAKLVNQPIVDTLQTTSQEIVAKIEQIIKILEANPANKQSEEAQKGLNEFISKLPSLINSFETISKALAPLQNIANLFTGGAKKAAGGLITGPGGPKSDKVPLMASSGEFVMQASAVKKIGLPMLSALNQGVIPGFKEGGVVGKGRKVANLPFIGSIYEDDLERSDKALGLANIAINSTQDVNTLKGLIADDVEAKLQLWRKGRGIRISQALPGISVRFDDDGKPVFTNVPDGGAIPLDGSLVGINLENKQTFDKDFKNRRTLIQDKQAREEGEKLRDNAIKNLFKRAQDNEKSENLFGKIDSQISGRTSNLSRRLSTSLSNLTRVGALNQSSEGRDVLDAEINEGTLGKEIDAAIADISAVRGILTSLRRDAIRVTDPATGNLVQVGEAYFGKDAVIDPTTGAVKGAVYSSDLTSSIERLKGVDLEQLILEAKGISAHRAKQFNLAPTNLGAKLDFLTEELPDSVGGNVAKGLIRAPLRLAAVPADLATGTVSGVADIGKAVVRRDGAALKEAAVGALVAPVRIASEGFTETGQALGAGAFLSTGKGDSDLRLEASREFGEKFGSGVGKLGETALTIAAAKSPGAFKGAASSVAGGIATRASKIASRIPGGELAAGLASRTAAAVKNKAAVAKEAGRGLYSNLSSVPEGIGKLRASQAISELSRKALNSRVGNKLLGEAGSRRRLVTGSLGLGLGAAALPFVSGGAAVALSLLPGGLRGLKGFRSFLANRSRNASLSSAVDNIDLGPSGGAFDNIDLGPAGSPIITPPPTGPAPTGPSFTGPVQVGAAQGRRSVNSPFSGIVSNIRLPKSGPLLETPLDAHINNSGFQFRTENLAEHINSSRFVNKAIGVVDDSFGGGTVGSSLSSSKGAFNASSRGGTAALEGRGLLEALKLRARQSTLLRLSKIPGSKGIKALNDFFAKEASVKNQGLAKELSKILDDSNVPSGARDIGTSSLQAGAPKKPFYGEFEPELLPGPVSRLSALEEAAAIERARGFAATVRDLNPPSTGPRTQVLDPVEASSNVSAIGTPPLPIRKPASSLLTDPGTRRAKADGKELIREAEANGLQPLGPATNLAEVRNALRSQIGVGSTGALRDAVLRGNLPEGVISGDLAKAVSSIGSGTITEELRGLFQKKLTRPLVVGKDKARLLEAFDKASSDEFRSKVGAFKANALLHYLDSQIKNLSSKRFASGGAISGPGGPTADKVPILASNGEFIMNSAAVKKLGIPFMNFINKNGTIPFGEMPKFAEGGLVGSSSSSPNSSAIEVRVDTREIASAISMAVKDALASSSIGVDSDGAAKEISAAISDAMQNIKLPEITVQADALKVPLDIPAAGIPLDVSSLRGLNLGDNLGSAVRNRLEAVEGSVVSLREDTNEVLNKIEGFDFSAVDKVSEEVSELRQIVEPIPASIALIDAKVDVQKQEIMDKVFTMINEQLNTSLQNITAGVDSRLAKLEASTESRFTNVENLISIVTGIANEALSRSFARF